MNYLQYVLNLTKFAFHGNRLLYLGVVISILSVSIELMAMSSLLPLFEIVSGNSYASNGVVTKMLTTLDFAVSAEALLWTFLILFALRIITQLAGQTLSMYLGKRVMAQLCSRAFEQIMTKLDICDINEKSMGFYISLAGDESFRASSLVIALTQFVSTVLLGIFYFIAIALYSPAVATFILAFLICLLGMFLKVVRLSHRMGGRQTEESRRTGSMFLDAMNNIKTVRAFTAEKYAVDIHKALIFGYTKILFWVDEISLLTRVVPVLLLLMAFSAWLTLDSQSIENLGLAFIVTMIVYLMRFFPTVGQGVNLLMKIASDAKSGRDVTSILDIKAANKANAIQYLESVRTIDFLEVSFAYGASGRKKVLEGINLRLERGKSYALAGKSGVGKSTLIDILLKFYLPTSGVLLLNNIDVSDVADTEVRKKIILVSQEAAIFDDTVINNICMGMDATLAEVQSACRGANIHEHIDGLPNGYQTRLQYQGKNLSGGQRQRIAIARALLRKPDVLILDESTSALDKATQHRVVDHILKEYANKIVVFVTHDPYVMKSVSDVIDLAQINHVSRHAASESDHVSGS